METKQKRPRGRPKGSKNKIKKEEMVKLPKVPKSIYNRCIDFINKIMSKK